MDEAVIKRSAKIRNLASLLDIVIVDKKQVQIDPMVLFSRLTLLVQREGEASSYLKYKLTTEPTFLCKDNFMRAPDKPLLLKGLSPVKIMLLMVGFFCIG